MPKNKCRVLLIFQGVFVLFPCMVEQASAPLSPSRPEAEQMRPATLFSADAC